MPPLPFVNCKTNILQKTTHYSGTPLRFPGIAWASHIYIYTQITESLLGALDGPEMVIICIQEVLT